MMFNRLNEPDIPQHQGSDAYRRVLAQLGVDIATIAHQLQLRPTAVLRVDQGGPWILVRLSTPSEHIVVRIAPDSDLAAEVYFGRALERRYIPTPRIIHADISRLQFPFAYLVETFVGGMRGDRITEAHLLRGAARQLGRACRQFHAISVAGWGRPTPLRGWTADSWSTALRQLAGDGTLDVAGRLIFGEQLQAQILEASIEAADHAPPQPRLIHGALGPASIIVTPGEQAQLVAIIEPGPIIGGDPLLDLARVLDPTVPAAFREGFLSGYLVGALSATDEQRLQRLRLLDCYLTACRSYLLAQPYEQAAMLAYELLDVIQNPA